MANHANMAIKFSDIDKAMLRELAARLQRNQSETIRALVRESLAILKEQDLKKQPRKPKQAM